MNTEIDNKIREKLPGVEYQVLLENHTTFRIGGPARFFLAANTKEKVIQGVKAAVELGIPFYLIGGGSKLLISDKGFNGLIIKVKNAEFEIKDDYAVSGAGLSLDKLIKESNEAGLTGLEWAAGIPGTVGGAVRGNAGAWYGSMKDVVEEVEAFDSETGKIRNISKANCDFSYRSSVFKKNANLIVLSCKIRLKKGDKKKGAEEMAEYVDYRRKKHPLEFPSAGSIFKNPSSEKESTDKEKPEGLARGRPMAEGLPAGRLIAESGLAGRRIGNVKISERHSNFIVNLGGGKAEEVKELIALAKQEVKEKFGINLEEELQYLE